MGKAHRSPPSPALAAMLDADAKAGVDVFDHGPQPARAPGPPVQVEPLIPLAIPEPNWRAELEEQARRDADVGQLDEPEESLRAEPAKRRKREKSATPNLDRVKRWKGTG